MGTAAAWKLSQPLSTISARKPRASKSARVSSRNASSAAGSFRRNAASPG